jgi:hypothetical protein
VENSLGDLFNRSAGRVSSEEIGALQELDRIGQSLCDLVRFADALRDQAKSTVSFDLIAATAPLLLDEVAERLRGRSDSAKSVNGDLEVFGEPMADANQR